MDNVALTGMKFFRLTRGVVISVCVRAKKCCKNIL